MRVIDTSDMREREKGGEREREGEMEADRQGFLSLRWSLENNVPDMTTTPRGFILLIHVKRLYIVSFQ